MDAGEFLTRATIWITIAAYTVGSVLFARSHGRARWDAAVRVAWTIAVVSLIAHFICAYQFFHHWSQDSALRNTARQTEEVTGLKWSGGLFINYGLLILWIADVAWWWIGGLTSYRARPWPVIAAWHGFIIFILFNATIVFKNGMVRWVGLVICAILLFAWARIARQGLGPRLKTSKA
jgi:general stress protein CsbA